MEQGVSQVDQAAADQLDDLARQIRGITLDDHFLNGTLVSAAEDLEYSARILREGGATATIQPGEKS